MKRLRQLKLKPSFEDELFIANLYCSIVYI